MVQAGSAAAWDDNGFVNKGTCFPTEVSTHTGRVQVADSMRTHQDLVENAEARVETNLPYHVVHYQTQRKKNPDWLPSPWNAFVRKQQNKVFKEGVDKVFPEVDCGPPEQAMKYSKWRGGFRKRMEKKGLQKTKATEIMWSWQEEQHAKSHLRRHKHVVKHTPSCVDHYPPEKAMQYRAWRRKTAGQHKVDAPLPRPKSANAGKWKTTFKQLNMSMDGLTKKDLCTPLLDLSLPVEFGSDFRQEDTEPSQSGLGSTPIRGDPRSSVEILEDEQHLPSPDGRPLTSDVETSVPSRPSSSQSYRPSSRPCSRRPSTSNGAKRPRSQQSSRPQSQQSSRPKPGKPQPTRASTAKLARDKPGDMAQDIAVHKGRPIDFSRALAGAYMGAASNENVKLLLSKNSS